MDASPTYLDGNAAAGPLADLLAFDVTATVGTCTHCGASKMLAQGRVYSAGPGLVLRCAACDGVLIRLVVAEERAWLDMTGLACLQIDRSVPG